MSDSIRINIASDSGASCRLSAMRRDAIAEQNRQRREARENAGIKAYRPSDTDTVATALSMQTTD